MSKVLLSEADIRSSIARALRASLLNEQDAPAEKVTDEQIASSLATLKNSDSKIVITTTEGKPFEYGADGEIFFLSSPSLLSAKSNYAEADLLAFLDSSKGANLKKIGGGSVAEALARKGEEYFVTVFGSTRSKSPFNSEPAADIGLKIAYSSNPGDKLPSAVEAAYSKKYMEKIIKSARAKGLKITLPPVSGPERIEPVKK